MRKFFLIAYIWTIIFSCWDMTWTIVYTSQHKIPEATFQLLNFTLVFAASFWFRFLYKKEPRR